MSNKINPDLDSKEARENKTEYSDQIQEHTGTVFGSFADESQGTGMSIGTGTSDQGIEPGEEGEEDEFRKGISGDSPGAGFNDATTTEAGGLRGNSGGPVGNLSGEYDTNSSSAGGSGTMDKGMGGNNQPPHGLVEEGPGPDS